MNLMIEISDETYKDIMYDAKNAPRNLNHYERLIARGIPIINIPIAENQTTARSVWAKMEVEE